MLRRFEQWLEEDTRGWFCMLNWRNYTRNGYDWNPMSDMELESLRGGSYFLKGGFAEWGVRTNHPTPPPDYGPVYTMRDTCDIARRMLTLTTVLGPSFLLRRFLCSMPPLPPISAPHPSTYAPSRTRDLVRRPRFAATLLALRHRYMGGRGIYQFAPLAS